MADQPCLSSVDFPTLASCDPRNHYLAWPLPVWRPPNPPCWLANTPFCWWLAGWLCNCFCPTVLVPEWFEAFGGGRNLSMGCALYGRICSGTGGNLLQDGQSLVNVPSLLNLFLLAQPFSHFLLAQHVLSILSFDLLVRSVFFRVILCWSPTVGAHSNVM